MEKIYKLVFGSIALLISLCLIKNTATACQGIQARIVSTSPIAEPNDSTLIKICRGVSITFTGTATFDTTGVGATYQWKVSDGTILNGTTATHTFANEGVYVVDFIVTDSSGCTNNSCALTRIYVQVSTTPLFTGTGANPSQICLGESATLHGVVVPVPGEYNCAPPVSDTTFLPDGSGVSYSTSINVTCFTPCDSITDGDQIESICLNMEHSYMGDLDIQISCPSGNEIYLKNGGGSGTVLGEPVATELPVDASSLTLLDPGIGYTYCFAPGSTSGFITDAANWTTIAPYTDPLGNVSTTVQQANPGTYQAVGNWDDLIGCPLNGNWTITVTDNLNQDNGYIFYWGIEFGLLPPNYSFLPTYPTIGWSEGSGNDVVVTPTTGGNHCYTFTVTDDFECTYDTTICLTVIDPGNPGEDSAAIICLNEDPVNVFQYLAGNPEFGGTWSGPGVTSGGIFDPSVAGIGTHNLIYTKTASGCDTQATVTITVNNDVNVDFDFSINKGCSGDTVIFTNSSEPSVFWWNFGDGSIVDSLNHDPTHFYNPQNEYSVKLIAQNDLGCKDSVTKIVDTRHPFNAAFSLSSDSVCQTENMVSINDQSDNVDYWHWDFGDGYTTEGQSASHSYSQAGTFTITLITRETGLPCLDTAYATVYVDSTPHIDIIIDRDSICNGERVNFSLDYLPTAIRIFWDFGDGSTYDGLDNITFHSYDNPGFYTVKATSEHPVCPAVTDIDTVVVKPFPVVQLGPDTAICLNGEPYFVADSINLFSTEIKWLWSTGDTTAAIPIMHPGIYSLRADLNGCITTDEIKISKDCYADIPNTFTPNDDGVNDYFLPRQFLTKGVTKFKMTILNRWGEKIYETSNLDGRGWDGRLNGKNQPVGVYVYIIDIEYKNKAAEHYEGNVSLLR